MTGAQFLGPNDPAIAIGEFIKTCRSFDAEQFREGAPFAGYEPVLRGMFPPPGKKAKAPKEAEGLRPDQWMDFPQDEFNLQGLGDWVTIVPDPRASDEQAARMPATHNQWATQYPIPGDLGQFRKWHCYIVARCDAKVKSGNAFQIGLDDAPGNKNVAGQTVTIEPSGDGEYHTFDLGVQDLKGGMYFWIAPMKNSDQVDAFTPIEYSWCGSPRPWRSARRTGPGVRDGTGIQRARRRPVDRLRPARPHAGHAEGSDPGGCPPPNARHIMVGGLAVAVRVMREGEPTGS